MDVAQCSSPHKALGFQKIVECWGMLAFEHFSVLPKSHSQLVVDPVVEARFLIKYFYLLMCVCMCSHMSQCVCGGQTEDKLQEVMSLHHGPWGTY